MEREEHEEGSSDRIMNGESKERKERNRKGSGLAVDALLERHLPGLRAFIRQRAGSLLRAKESASDLAQSACRQVLQHIGRFRYSGEAGFKRWLYATALRKIRNRYEYYLADKRNAGLEVRCRWNSTASGDHAVLERIRSISTPSRHAMLRERMEQLDRAFIRLPDDYATVIHLARMMSLPRAEVAERMGRSENAVRTLLSRALARLAEILDEEGDWDLQNGRGVR